jgi:uncharacterized protein
VIWLKKFHYNFHSGSRHKAFRKAICEDAEWTKKNKNTSVFGVGILTNAQFKIASIKIDNSNIISLQTTAQKLDNGQWKDQLYKEVSKKPAEKINVRLVPYYAWGNRGHTEMSVWLPVIK